MKTLENHVLLTQKEFQNLLNQNNIKKRNFTIVVAYAMTQIVNVDAYTFEEACNIVDGLDISLSKGKYVDDSFTVDVEKSKAFNDIKD
uniref:Uncharacterized protein n=1 Tax=viral metagenome TaxID=1070528 RepID=A0A6M3JN84_9ZZZZ